MPDAASLIPSVREVAPFVALARRIEGRASQRKRIARAFVLIYDEER